MTDEETDLDRHVVSRGLLKKEVELAGRLNGYEIDATIDDRTLLGRVVKPIMRWVFPSSKEYTLTVNDEVVYEDSADTGYFEGLSVDMAEEANAALEEYLRRRMEDA